MPRKQTPKRRRGGQELPEKVQDRPEQNEGYDEAVRSGEPLETADDMSVDDITEDPQAISGRRIRRTPDE